jgi:hypothetical protein
MSTYETREKLVMIAIQDRGKLETSHNQGDWIEKYWPATSYPDGYENAEPYCAAGMCWWVREWMKLPETQAAFGKSFEYLDDWRPDSAAVFDWNDWAEMRDVPIIGREDLLHTGDIMIFDCSHIGVVWTDRGDNILTMEANTGPMGERDGDGAYIKIRSRNEARNFIRMLE